MDCYCRHVQNSKLHGTDFTLSFSQFNWDQISCVWDHICSTISIWIWHIDFAILIYRVCFVVGVHKRFLLSWTSIQEVCHTYWIHLVQGYQFCFLCKMGRSSVLVRFLLLLLVTGKSFLLYPCAPPPIVEKLICFCFRLPQV